MNVTPELLLAFQQLRDAAWQDDHIDGQCRGALAAACRAYEDLVAGRNQHYERPVPDAHMWASIDEKTFYAFCMADEHGLPEIADAIIQMRIALGLVLSGRSNGGYARIAP